MDALGAIYGRRSIRKYAERAVSKDRVLTLLRAAAQAPSAVNLQPWAFIVGYPSNGEPPMVPARREPAVLCWTKASGGRS